MAQANAVIYLADVIATRFPLTEPESRSIPMPATTLHPSPCLARQAIAIYDHDGEAAMLEFVKRNRDSQPLEADNNPQAITVLTDHTALLITANNYQFLWTPPKDHLLLSNEPPRRARNLKGDVPVPAEPRPIPAAGAATRDTVLHEALKHLETDVRLDLRHSETGPWLAQASPVSESEVQAVAPSSSPSWTSAAAPAPRTTTSTRPWTTPPATSARTSSTPHPRPNSRPSATPCAAPSSTLAPEPATPTQHPRTHTTCPHPSWS